MNSIFIFIFTVFLLAGPTHSSITEWNAIRHRKLSCDFIKKFKGLKPAKNLSPAKKKEWYSKKEGALALADRKQKTLKCETVDKERLDFLKAYPKDKEYYLGVEKDSKSD